MIRIAIVEDDKKDAEKIGEYVQTYADDNGVEVSVNSFATAIPFLDSLSLIKYDIVFMDIEMPVMDGMEASRRLRKVDKDVVLILITNLVQFAVNGYEVEAFDFVVKPIGYYNFSIKMQRALQRISTINDEKISVKTKDGLSMIAVNSIRYIEIFNHSLVFHTENGVIESSGKLVDVESSLPESDFFRCSRCYLVNLNYVSSINENTAKVGGDILQISRRRKKDFVTALAAYFQKKRGS